MRQQPSTCMTVGRVARQVKRSRPKVHAMAKKTECCCPRVAGGWTCDRVEIDRWMMAARQAPTLLRGGYGQQVRK